MLNAVEMSCCHFGGEVYRESISVAIQQVTLFQNAELLEVRGGEVVQASSQMSLVDIQQ